MNDEIYKNTIKDIKNKIEIAKNIIITGHVNPDGDAVGSGLALMISLREFYKNKKSIRYVLQDHIPYTTNFLKYSEEIEKFYEENNYDTDLFICVDSASLDRTGKVGIKLSDNFIINIDHHYSNTKYGNINLVLNEKSSTSEIMYSFLRDLEYPINKEVAESIYLGIVNDTGNFSHKNVSVNTMKIATELREIGVDNHYIVTNFLNSNSMPALKILGDALTNFVYYEDVNLSFYYLSKETMEKLNAKKEDTEGLVEKILSYYDASVSLFLREENNVIKKGSMRSKKEIDVNKIANIFGGGGHIKAAGFSSDKNKEEILQIIKKEIKKQINNF